MPESNSIVPKLPAEPNESSTPEDVATLYSWANLHGAKYRDFSASRAEAREESRLRVEEAKAIEQRRLDEEAERRAQEEAQIAARLAAEAAEAARQAEAERLAEIARQAEAERQAVLTAQEAQRQAALQRAWQPPPPEAYQGHMSAPFTAVESEPASSVQLPSIHDRSGNLPPQFSGQESEGLDHPVAQSNSGSQWPQFAPLQYPSPTQYPGPAPREPMASQAPPAPVQQQKQHSFSPSSPAPVFQSPVNRMPNPAANPYPEFQNPGYPNREYSAQEYPGVNLPDSRFPEARFPDTGFEPLQYPAAQPETYAPSPWQMPELRDSRDMRDQISQPAWLAPELSPAPAQPAARIHSAAPIQQEFSAQSPAHRPPSQPVSQPTASASYPGSFSGRTSTPASHPAPAPNQFQGQIYNQPGVQNPSQSSTQNPPQNFPPDLREKPNLVDDTLVGSRDRIANRWYALKSVFDPQSAPVEQIPAQPPARIPVLAVFSLAGGVGKTSLVASLGRALSSRGERVLLVDTAAYGLLPFFFGARDQRPGMLRTFNPPGSSAEAPIQLVTLDPEGQAPEYSEGQQQQRQDPQNQDWLSQEVGRYARGSNRILIDLPTASGSTTRRVLRMNPVVLVPVAPDMNSVVSVGAIESFFRHSAATAGGQPIMPYYVLNQFDYSLPLHLDVREILREQIGDRLLPFALRRSAAVSEALAEGMTVMDYAPNAVVAEDYANLAGWVRSLSAPATQSYRGVRWSER